MQMYIYICIYSCWYIVVCICLYRYVCTHMQFHTGCFDLRSSACNKSSCGAQILLVHVAWTMWSIKLMYAWECVCVSLMNVRVCHSWMCVCVTHECACVSPTLREFLWSCIYIHMYVYVYMHIYLRVYVYLYLGMCVYHSHSGNFHQWLSNCARPFLHFFLDQHQGGLSSLR